MKSFVLLITLCLAFPPLPAESPPDIRVGDDRLTVLDTLGPPNGRIEMGDLERLFFDRGEIKLREGTVTEVNLISEAAARTRREEAARASEARRERGEALKAERLADPEFRALPAAQRYAFWRDFRQEFPEVDVFAPYTDAKAAAELDAERQRTAARLAEVERRVADAEHRARQAETTALTLSTPTRVQYFTPFPVFYRNGVAHPFPPHRPLPRPTPAPPRPPFHIRIEGTNPPPFTSTGGLSTAESISGSAFRRSSP